MDKILDMGTLMQELGLPQKEIEKMIGEGFSYVLKASEVAWIGKYRAAKGFEECFKLGRSGCPDFLVVEYYENLRRLCKSPWHWKCLHECCPADIKTKIFGEWVEHCKGAIVSYKTKENLLYLFKNCPEELRAKVLKKMIEIGIYRV